MRELIYLILKQAQEKQVFNCQESPKHYRDKTNLFIPATSMFDFVAVLADIMAAFHIVFYQSAEDAVFQAHGVEQAIIIGFFTHFLVATIIEADGGTS